ncbi:hybrid sensor histidine kinase/response regulator transcription factor [Sphingobacterium chungjuense]|uniref:hybrid sensor histidine kinase/response regulator transcription factor n=1 Tax=Sphingobacterium chungjuense TaxID=2675553 RepID=UPI0014089CE5|nr:two-component regulator propeller domain-containing protein [Sphingobacterium chungjuense]
MKAVALCIISTLCAFSFAFAQDHAIDFQRLYSKDGLSSNTIHALIRDHFGFLWIGTEDGLNRFDGKSFKIYRRNPTENNGLGINHVTSLHEDANGRLWIGTNGGGVAYYDRKTDRVIQYSPNTASAGSTAINSISSDNQGNIMVSAFGAFYCINGTTQQLHTDGMYAEINKRLQGKISHCSFTDQEGNLWIAADQTLYQYNRKLQFKQEYQVASVGAGNRSDHVIRAIIQDDRGVMWFASTEGLLRFNTQRNALESASKLMQGDKLYSNNLYAIDKDNKGNLWIGSDKGLHLFNVNTFKLTQFKPEKGNLHSLSTHSIRSILIDNYGISWVGTYQGGLNKYDSNLNEFNLRVVGNTPSYSGESAIVTSLSAINNDIYIGTDGNGVWNYDKAKRSQHIVTALPGDLNVLAMEQDDNTLWLGTYQKGLYGYDVVNKEVIQFKEGIGDLDLNSNEIFTLKKDRKGNLWVGTNGRGVNVLGKDRKLITKYDKLGYVRAIEELDDTQMWIGTYGAGITVINPLTQISYNLNAESHQLPSNYISSIYHDSAGNTWVGTSGNGIGVLKKGQKKFTLLSAHDGLLNGMVYKIMEDDSGKIWISTSQGLSCYDVQTGVFKNYSHSAGLQSGAFSLGAGLKMKDGELFFGGQHGFNHFYPDKLKINKNPAQIVFTSLRVDNTNVDPGVDQPITTSILMEEKMQLRYDQNFSIFFEALNFTVPEDNQYEYLLEGFDKSWVSVGKEHVASYTNIPPGNYQFRVRASNNDGVWGNNERSIEVVITPPWWRTIPAYMLYAAIVLGGLLLIRARGIKRLKAQFALEQERVSAKQLIEQERKDAEQLRKLDKMKIKFLTNLSHEFKTPISLIKGPIDNMLLAGDSLKNIEQLKFVQRNSERLLRLVNQLLDFRKLEENEITLYNIEGELVSFIRQSVASFGDLALQKGIALNVVCSTEELFVSFDKDKLERIIFNLLSNAFKFTARGGTIDVRLNHRSLDNCDEFLHIDFSIEDSGVGIAEEHTTRIFDRFFQIHPDENILNQGSGIGLSIVKSFVELYQGTIHVISEMGRGSAFYFDLKLKKSLYASESLVEENGSIADGQSVQLSSEAPKILIVEDDSDFRLYLRRHLQEHYQIIEAENGMDGWQKALFYHPDIIVSDVQMPIMNGVEFVQKLHLDKRTMQIPVILLTAANIPNGAIYGIESGAVDYLNKPFDMPHFMAKVNRLLMLSQAVKHKYLKQVDLISPTTEIVSENEKFLKKAYAYIEENMANSQLSVESLSAYLSISRASLYNKLLDYTGMTPVEYIRSTKLDRAKELLQRSNKSIAEVAYELGFANPNYFTKVFKAHFNKTPSAYIQAKKQV